MKRIYIIFMLLNFSIPLFSQSQNKTIFADSVFSYICEKNILQPNIVMKQAIIETGYFYPNNLMKKNNLFGFRIGGKCLAFNTWQESVDYYKNWQDRKYTNPDEDYYKFLVRIKYATSHYPNKLKKITYDKTCPDKRKIISDTTKLKNIQPITEKPTDTKIQEPPKNVTNVTIYKVKKGDTLSEIALKNKTTVTAIKKNNNLKSNTIHPGQKLKIIKKNNV